MADSPNYAVIAECVVVGQLHGSETNNVLHFGSNIVPFVPGNLADAVFAMCTGPLNDAISGEQSIVELRIRQLKPVVTDPESFFPDAPIHGPDFTPALPSFNAALMAIKTGLGGRSKRGRIFWPGVIQNDVQQSVFTNAGIAKWQAVADYFRDNFIPAVDPAAVRNFNIGVLSKMHQGQPLPGYGEFTGANLLVPRQIVATMHSRKKGVGS